MEKQIFTFVDTLQQMYELPNLSPCYQGYRALSIVSSLRYSNGATTAELMLELPGPIYVFLVHFEPRFIKETATIVINGVVPFTDINPSCDVPIEEDARLRLLLYLGHLLLFCFCKGKYKTPFRMYRSVGPLKYETNLETRKELFAIVETALKQLGYNSVAYFMPILAKCDLDDPKTYLNVRYYSELFPDPAQIGDFINIPELPATIIEPIFSSRKASS